MLSGEMVVLMASRGAVFCCWGMLNEALHSKMRGSSECQSGGILPCKIRLASGERLENVIASWIMPCPQGDSDAARNASRL